MARSKRGFYANFLYEPQVSIQAKNTMAIVTAAGSQEDFFRVRGQYLELYQGAANTALAAAGLTPSVTGWLLPGDNTAADSVEVTTGIVLGQAPVFVSGTDAFQITGTFLVGTLNRITHLQLGFRNLAAYADCSTAAKCLGTAGGYTDKISAGIVDNAGTLALQASLSGTDTQTTATLTPAVAADVLAIRVKVAKDLTVTTSFGSATPAGGTLAQTETARLAAIADLTADTLCNAAATSLVTTAINFVPCLIYGMAGGTDVSDFKVLSLKVEAL